jgi:acyl-CoA dehydrogenase
LPTRIPAFLLRAILFPLGKPFAPPQDYLVGQLAQMLLHDNAARDRLTAGIYINEDPTDATGRIETAFKAVLQASEAGTKIHTAQKQGKLPKASPDTIIKLALSQGVINQTEADLMIQAEYARLLAISVDDFNPEELIPLSVDR